jgi:sec-independent protein translocase protein TatA
MLMIYPLMIGTWEIVAIVLVVLLLFGGKKIPELMKGLGQGVKSFKQGMNEVEKEIKDIDKEDYNKEEKK